MLLRGRTVSQHGAVRRRPPVLQGMLVAFGKRSVRDSRCAYPLHLVAHSHTRAHAHASPIPTLAALTDTQFQTLYNYRAFGQGKLHLKCIDASGCTELFPIAQIRKACTEELYTKLISRQGEEALSSLELPNLISCPKPDCGFSLQMYVEIRWSLFFFWSSNCGTTTSKKKNRILNKMHVRQYSATAIN